MVVRTQPDPRCEHEHAQPIADAVVWHDLECGSYAIDLPLWQELAAEADGPVLDVGAGTGRVTLALARQGRTVTAVERDGELLEALRERAATLTMAAAVTTVQADARSLALEHDDYALCIAAMQTIQLFEGESGRSAFLRGARARLRPGGVLACAIVTEVEPFDCASGDMGPSPELLRLGQLRYISRATRVCVSREHIQIERERRILPDTGRSSCSPKADAGAGPHAPLEQNIVSLDRISVEQLQAEGRAAGLTPRGVHTIAATEEHTGCTAVLFGA